MNHRAKTHESLPHDTDLMYFEFSSTYMIPSKTQHRTLGVMCDVDKAETDKRREKITQHMTKSLEIKIMYVN